MKYYSRSPQEIIDQSEKKDSKNQKKRRVGYLILVVDIVIILLVLTFFLQKRNSIVHNNSKEINWQGWLVKPQCSKDFHCDLTMQQELKEAAEISAIRWHAMLNKKEIFTSTHYKKLANYKVTIPFVENQQIWMSLVNKDNQVLLKLKVFP